MLQKHKRTVDPNFLADMRKLPCIACGVNPPNEAHHIKTRGSGGGDDAFNILPLCRLDHILVHQLGDFKFYNAHPHLLEYLHEMGWTFDTRKKLTRT